MNLQGWMKRDKHRIIQSDARLHDWDKRSQEGIRDREISRDSFVMYDLTFSGVDDDSKLVTCHVTSGCEATDSHKILRRTILR